MNFGAYSVFVAINYEKINIWLQNWLIVLNVVLLKGAYLTLNFCTTQDFSASYNSAFMHYKKINHFLKSRAPILLPLNKRYWKLHFCIKTNFSAISEVK